MVAEVYTADTANTDQKSASTGNIFLDILDRAADWDATRRFGLPADIDGGTATPVSAPEQQRVERTPPAPPGESSGIIAGVSNNTLLIGAGVVLAAGLAIWALK